MVAYQSHDLVLHTARADGFRERHDQVTTTSAVIEFHRFHSCRQLLRLRSRGCRPQLATPSHAATTKQQSSHIVAETPQPPPLERLVVRGWRWPARVSCSTLPKLLTVWENYCSSAPLPTAA